tara:strand:- start:205 stop:744 length:540 start_codon:yes stop_codon:yes gene_type:complete
MEKEKIANICCYYLTSIIAALTVSRSTFVTGYILVTITTSLNLFIVSYYRLLSQYDFLVTLVLMTAGLMIDFTLQQAGIIVFNAPTFDKLPLPYWMVILWVSFSTNTFTVTRWIYSHPIYTGLALCIGITLGYWIGIRIGMGRLSGDDIRYLGYWSIYWLFAGSIIGYLNLQIQPRTVR